MNGLEKLSIWVSSSGTKAIIQYLPRSATIDDIQLDLSVKKVTNGIAWDVINSALSQVNATGIPITNLLIAEATKSAYTFTLFNEKTQVVQSEFEQELDLIKKISLYLNNGTQQENISGSVFALKGDTIAVVEKTFSATNIFGDLLKENNPVFINIDNEHIQMDTDDLKCVYSALSDGYVYFDNENKLSIYSCTKTDSVKGIVDFRVVPVKYGRKKLIEYFQKKTLEYHQAQHNAKDLSSLLLESLDKNVISSIVIGAEKKSVDGKDAIIIYNAIMVSEKKLNNEQKIDYREHSPYCEVEKGQILVTIVKEIPGVDGVDIHGKPIAAAPVKKIELIPGQNVSMRTESDKTIFESKIDGVLHLDGKVVDVSEILVINGNIGPETGNVKHLKDVMVKGDIQGGYKIECEGNLFVNGNVENNVSIFCSGNLNVKGGIFGELTKCMIQKNATIGFIQGSKITVRGTLIVNDFLYDSEIICRENVEVKGKNHHSDEHGALIGGVVNSYKSITVHSVGSATVKTILKCGIDLEAKILWNSLKETEQPLLRKIMTLQAAVGVNLHDPAVADKIKMMPESVRNKIKGKIDELKHTIEQRNKLVAALNVVSSKILNTDIDSLQIKILKKLIPDVTFEIGNKNLTVNESQNTVTYKIIDNVLRKI